LLVLAVALAAGALVWLGTRESGSTRVPWRLTAEPAGTVIHVRAEFGGSSCATFDRWQVDQSSAEVEIRATAHIEEGDCTADLVFEPHTVRLEAPLGDRRLVGCLGSDGNADCTEIADG
jgi:hypothetical protein